MLRHRSWPAMVLALLFLPFQSTWAYTCISAFAGTQQWNNHAIQAQTTRFNTTVSAMPTQSNSDVLFGFAKGAQTTWSGLAVIVRFNRNGTIDVRNGNAYSADAVVPYEAYGNYRFRLEVDVPAHRYSVYVRVGDGPEQALARNYAFRSEQQAVTSLDHFTVEAEIGTLEACLGTVGTCKTALPGSQQWQNTLLPQKVGTAGYYGISWEVTPHAAGSDVLLALSQGPKRTWSGLGAIVRFNRNNTIDVRNGDRYMADQVVTYAPNTRYKVNIGVGDYSYSVAVAGPDGVWRQIASKYAFRTEQQNVSYFDNWVLEAEIGGVDACLVDMTSD